MTRLALSAVQREWGRLDEALRTLDELAPALETIGDPRALARAALGRGMLFIELGDLPAAHEACERALASYRERGDSYGQALTLRSIGIAHRAEGRFAEAEVHSKQAVDLMRALGDELMPAYAQQSLAKARIRQGLGAGSRVTLEACLQTCVRLQDGFGQALMLRTPGELELADGRLVPARRHLERSLQWWEALDLTLWRARTLRDLATALRALGETEAADQAWADALAGFERHGSREAGEPRPITVLVNAGSSPAPR